MASASVAEDRAEQVPIPKYREDIKSKIVSVSFPELGATWVNRRHVDIWSELGERPENGVRAESTGAACCFWMRLILCEVSGDVGEASLASLEDLHLKVSYPGQTLQAVAQRLQTVEFRRTGQIR